MHIVICYISLVKLIYTVPQSNLISHHLLIQVTLEITPSISQCKIINLNKYNTYANIQYLKHVSLKTLNTCTNSSKIYRNIFLLPSLQFPLPTSISSSSSFSIPAFPRRIFDFFTSYKGFNGDTTVGNDEPVADTWLWYHISKWSHWLVQCCLHFCV